MTKIFISYRREDSQYQADRLHAVLTGHVADPKQDIFIDIDNIPPGVNFVQHLDSKVGQCDALLAIIGSGWLNAKNPETGARRLDDPKDFVRIEIAAALKMGIPVVPVLLDGVAVPAARDLPEDLQELSVRNGVDLRRISFESDAERLIHGLGLMTAPPKAIVADPRVAPTQPAPSRRRNPVPIDIAVGFILAVGASVWMIDPFAWRQGGQTTSAYMEGAPSAITQSTDAAIGPSHPAEALPDPSSAPLFIPPSTPRAAGETFRDCSGCPAMVVIPAGSFMMGSPSSEEGRENSEGPQRRVSVSAFAAGKYEVTWAEWDRCAATGGCAEHDDDGYGKGSRPVTRVSWDDAQEYTRWVSGQSGMTYRLLSESEWEYAARAGTTTTYWWGETANRIFANYGKDVCCGGFDFGEDQWINTSPAGSFAANAFGLHDLHGNVWEFVEDCFGNDYSAGQPTDGSAFTKSSCYDRVARGGSYNDDPPKLRTAYRSAWPQQLDARNAGFRVARALP